MNKGKILPDNLLLSFLEECIKQILNELKTFGKNNYVANLELRDCIIWCLNVYVEIISPFSIRNQVDNEMIQFETKVNNF